MRKWWQMFLQTTTAKASGPAARPKTPQSLRTIKVKAGVIFHEINQYYLDVFEAINDVWPVECVITSANDGKHMGTSYHYKHLALGLRSFNIPKERQVEIRDALQRRLGTNHEVILEKDHYHVEVSPSGFDYYRRII